MTTITGAVTDSTTSAVNDPSAALSAATSDNNALGQDAFLKLLVAQISHQDPLKPMDDTAFVAQLAQFSALEQAMGTNKRLDALAGQQRGVSNTEVASLVGKNVTVSGSTVSLDSSGTGAPVRFSLASAASTVDVNVVNSAGTTVRTMHLTNGSAGLNNVTWDGRDDTGTQQPAGAYTTTIEAKNAGGVPIEVSQETTGVLKAVSFDQGYANLILDNGVSAPASNLIRVNAQ